MPQLPVLLAGVGLAALACILQVVSVATPMWVFTDDLTVHAGLNSSVDTGLKAFIDKDLKASIGEVHLSVSAGLWSGCLNLQGASTIICDSLDTVTDAMQAVRATSILGFLLLGAAAGVGALVALSPSLFRFVILAIAVAIAGEIMTVVGIVVFMTKKWGMYTNVTVLETLGIEFLFGYSTFLSIAAAVIGFFSTLGYAIARKRIDYQQLQP